jgi:glycosidase
MRRISVLSLVVAVLFSAFGLSTTGTSAASFRNHVARVPETPNNTQTVRIWMNSDTAFGETAGVEYNPVGTNTYVKVLGTYDTSYTGANWRADIPAFPAGTQIRYQLFTRNEHGGDYGFTLFNWTYTVTQQAACTISPAQVLHDSFHPDYRSHVGPTTPGNTVRLRIRVAEGDITSARVRLWDDRTNQQTYHNMAWDGDFDQGSTTYDWWYADIPTGSQPTILYYIFELNDNGNGGCSPVQAWYVDDDPKFYGGGYGAFSSTNDDSRSYQLTVYDPNFAVPEWIQRAVIYQIFPDRFRDSDPSNNPEAGRFSYARVDGTIYRSRHAGSPNNPDADWNFTVCDPRDLQSGFNCTNYYGDNFYGGDLRGITQKIEDGYFNSLGVTVLYLNPIFLAPSNHKYDTGDFMMIDPDFGTLADFEEMVAAANARGIRVMLDGVFNHTSSDSRYFDYYSRYDDSGNLTSAGGPGANDGSGACESSTSSYYSWFYFGGDYGNENGGTCANGPGGAAQNYRAWYGYGSLPKIDSNLSQVRQYFWSNGLASVGPYWTEKGASGWRFDVGGDVDPGLTNDPANDYWEGFRAAVRNQTVTGKDDVVMLGEEWGDASAWLLGNEWDSAMNYRFRSALLNWLATGCSGNGCSSGVFEDNDSNYGSSSGPISTISPSQFNARLLSIWEDYPPMAWKAMMNLTGSHDTNRVRFLLKKTNNNNDAAAVQRMKEWYLFAFTYAGAPTLYYGDEIGLTHDGVWANGKWEDDPYNRIPFPWPDTSGSSYGYGSGNDENNNARSANLLPFTRQMASIRHSYRALQDGDVRHGLIIDDQKKLYGFARVTGDQTALIALNRDGVQHNATFSGLGVAPYNLADGTILVNALSNDTYTVSGGSVTVPVSSSWGVILLEQNKIDTPAAPGAPTLALAGNDVQINWSPVISDSSNKPEVVSTYRVYRGTSAGFTPDESNRIGTLDVPEFGGVLQYSDAGMASQGAYYIVRAYNSLGQHADSPVQQAPVPDTTAPNVTVTFGDPNGQNGWFKSGPVVGSVTATDTSTIKNIVCVGATLSDVTGLDTATATGTLTVSDDGQHSVSCTATDGAPAGNSGSNTAVAIKLDTTLPTITFASQTPAANSAGWNNADVTVTWNCADAGSGVVQPAATDILSSDGQNQTAAGTCHDQAGNSAGATRGGINLDKSAPEISLANRTPANANGWNRGNVSLQWTCTDSGSGVVSSTFSTVVRSEGEDQSATGICVDHAGNAATDTQDDINIDKTKPTITFVSRTPLANDAGWHNSNVTVTWSCQDDLSGVISDVASKIVSSQGANQTTTGICTDLAGNPATNAQTGINIDKTRPTITFVSFTPAANEAGWHNSNVTVEWSCADSLSGPLQSKVTEEVTTPGMNRRLTGTCTDKAGNSASNVQSGINLDTRAPTVTLTGVTNGAVYPASSAPTPVCSTTDALSGVATNAALAVTGGNSNGLGTLTATCSGGADRAGNIAPPRSVTYRVQYTFSGFFSPVVNQPTVNVMAAGVAVPVRFSLGGDQGMDILATNFPKARAVSCDTGAPTHDVDETIPGGVSGLSYDTSTGQYTYLWRTNKGWTGACRELTFRFTDGTDQVLRFQFRP